MNFTYLQCTQAKESVGHFTILDNWTLFLSGHSLSLYKRNARIAFSHFFTTKDFLFFPRSILRIYLFQYCDLPMFKVWTSKHGNIWTPNTTYRSCTGPQAAAVTSKAMQTTKRHVYLHVWLLVMGMTHILALHPCHGWFLYNILWDSLHRDEKFSIPYWTCTLSNDISCYYFQYTLICYWFHCLSKICQQHISCHYVGCHLATLPLFHAHFQRAFASLNEFHLN